MKIFDSCDWAVCYTVPASTQDDRKPGRTVVAWFARPNAAQDFLEKCLPQENRDRFYILHRDNLND